MLTTQKLQIILKRNKNIDELCAVLNKVLPKYNINTTKRIAAFLSQCGHESGDFTILKENLNYSADGLMRIFKKYFPTIQSTNSYARNPEKIANKVYANRMGNGPESSGDGYKFRGRGAIQLTGKENYDAFAKSIGKNLDETIAFCETLEGAIESACWFWTKNNLNRFVDSDNIVGLSKAINGGTIGLEERIKYYNMTLSLLQN